MKARYDAIIVGGGPSGATAATLLARAGWRVAVVEKAQFPRPKVCGEFISGTTWPLLEQLGVARPLLEIAGRRVRRVGVYAGAAMVTAAWLRRSTGRRTAAERWAASTSMRCCSGAQHQPEPTCFSRARCRRSPAHDGGSSARSLTRAHGSPRAECAAGHRRAWLLGVRTDADAGLAPSAAGLGSVRLQGPFCNSTLPPDLMPLLAFPGGYGGMVHTDRGRVSLSCCIRRDRLEQCRRQWPTRKAGEAVLAHIKSSCQGVVLALSRRSATAHGSSSGPLRTGIRTFGHDGIFVVGNAAAEAHPIVAEGISMAIQSAALLCEQLSRARHCAATRTAPARCRQASNVTTRWHGAGTFHGACTWPPSLRTCSCVPLPTRVATALLKRLPQLLTEGARWSGKTEPLRGARAFDAARSERQ